MILAAETSLLYCPREGTLNISRASEKEDKKEQCGDNRKNKQKGGFSMPKYMNCHYGQSRIFRMARFKAMPDGIDSGAGGGGGGSTVPPDGTGDNSGDGSNNQPTYEELVAQLANERAEKLKMKNIQDKVSREAAEYKKQLRAKLTAEEQEEAAKKEADEAKDARIKELEEKMAVIDNTSFWGGKSIGMDEELAKATAEAEATGDKEKFRECITKHIKSVRDEAYQQAMSDRPSINAGNGAGDKNAVANEKAKAAAARRSGVNEDILNHYRR